MGDPARVLKVLDEYEECDATDPQAGLYRRAVVTVRLQDGTTEDACVYIYNQPTTGLERIPSGDFAAASSHLSAAPRRR